MWFALFLAGTTLSYVFGLWLDLRQRRMLAVSSLPADVRERHPALAAAVDETTFARSQRYGRDKSLFGLCKDAFDTLLSLALLWYGALPALWRLSREMLGPNRGEIAVSLVFAALAVLGQTALELPWDVYATFVLEAKHGFNKTTLRTFVADAFKSLALSFAIGGPVLAATVAIMRWAGGAFWFPLWLFLLCVSLALAVAYPVLILPIFNKLSPLEEGPLREAVVELAHTTAFPLKDIQVMDGSKRSAHSNAFLAGLRTKRIVLYDTLIEKLSADEVRAVLGHEVGHWKHWHIWKMLVVSELHSLLFLALASRFIDDSRLFSEFGFVNEKPVVIGLSLFAMAYGPIEGAFAVLMNAVSRRHEYQADAFSVVQCKSDMSSPLIKMHAENLSTLLVDPLYSAVHFSHPTLLERLRAIDQLKAE